MKKGIVSIVCILSVAFLCFACSKTSKDKDISKDQAAKSQGIEDQPVTELSYSIFFPPSHVQCKAADAWAEEIEKRSDGRVKINMFPAGTLTKAKDCYDGVVTGISAIGMSCFAYTRGRFPVMEAVDLPLGYPDGQSATVVANEFYNQVKPEELEDVKVLYLHAHGPGLLHTKKPVKTMDDLKGMKIRSTGLSAKVTDALGGVPVAMPQGGTYEALQKGVVDGTFTPIETLKGWKQAEVIDYTTDCNNIGYTTTMFVVMNKDKWNSLPDDIKKVFNQVDSEWIKVHADAWTEADKEGREYTLGLKNKIIPLGEDEAKQWKKAVDKVIGDYITKAKAKGIDAKKHVEDLKGLIKDSKNSNK